MKGILVRWLLLAVAIFIAAYMIDGIHVAGFMSAVLTAAVLGVLNAFFRPILLILTLPINILSLGVFTFVINAAMLKMASSLIPGFDVHGFWTAIFGSLIVSTVSFGVTMLISEKGDIHTIELHHRGGNRWE